MTSRLRKQVYSFDAGVFAECDPPVDAESPNFELDLDGKRLRLSTLSLGGAHLGQVSTTELADARHL